MKKEDQLIMGVERTLLFQDDYFEGFSPSSKVNFKSRIINSFEYQRRGDLESNIDYKQPINYVVLVDENNLIFFYKRAIKDTEYTEKRLQGSWSCGLGGHIDKEDEEGEDPILTSAKRELQEEVLIKGELLNLKEVGYINDDSGDVERFHFAILFLATVKGRVKKNDNEIMEYEMKSQQEMEEILDGAYNVERWSRIIIDNFNKIF